VYDLLSDKPSGNPALVGLVASMEMVSTLEELKRSCSTTIVVCYSAQSKGIGCYMVHDFNSMTTTDVT
jgi:hypothetical protein